MFYCKCKFFEMIDIENILYVINIYINMYIGDGGCWFGLWWV